MAKRMQETRHPKICVRRGQAVTEPAMWKTAALPSPVIILADPGRASAVKHCNGMLAAKIVPAILEGAHRFRSTKDHLPMK